MLVEVIADQGRPSIVSLKDDTGQEQPICMDMKDAVAQLGASTHCGELAKIRRSHELPLHATWHALSLFLCDHACA